LESWLVEVDLGGKYTGYDSYISSSTHYPENGENIDFHGRMLHLVYAVHGACYTWCMLYLVITNDHGMER
jgi:hypothetical protein